MVRVPLGAYFGTAGKSSSWRAITRRGVTSTMDGEFKWQLTVVAMRGMDSDGGEWKGYVSVYGGL